MDVDINDNGEVVITWERGGRLEQSIDLNHWTIHSNQSGTVRELPNGKKFYRVGPGFQIFYPNDWKNVARGDGYNCLYLGNSLLAPVLRPVYLLARQNYPYHHSMIQFAGGSGGSPAVQWINDTTGKDSLATGKIDVVHMAWWPTIGSDPEHYLQWINLALQHNENTRFIIQSIWPYIDGTLWVGGSYESTSEAYIDLFQETLGFVKDSRPNVDIKSLDLSALMTTWLETYTQAELYRDNIHPTKLATDLLTSEHYKLLYP